jgi:hypothetical protein
MDSMKNRRNWQIWVDQAEVDNSQWLNLLSDVLVCLTMELASTNMKDSVIANLTHARAEAIVKNFNEDELEGWKVGVRNGVKRNDWIDLLARRTYISDYFHNPIAFNRDHSGTRKSRDAEHSGRVIDRAEAR